VTFQTNRAEGNNKNLTRPFLSCTVSLCWSEILKKLLTLVFRKPPQNCFAVEGGYVHGEPLTGHPVYEGTADGPRQTQIVCADLSAIAIADPHAQLADASGYQKTTVSSGG
jgi:hypothetical protein